MRNVIERIFGLLNKRWGILQTSSFYDVKTQIRIINACCILHKFIRDDLPDECLLRDVDRELENAQVQEVRDNVEDDITIVQVTANWMAFRNTLAMSMFNDYQARRG